MANTWFTDPRAGTLEEWTRAAAASPELRRALGAGREGEHMRVEGARLIVCEWRTRAPHALVRLIDSAQEVGPSLEADLQMCAAGAAISYLATADEAAAVRDAIEDALGKRNDATVLRTRVELDDGTAVCAGSATGWTAALAAVHWTEGLAQLGALRMERAARALAEERAGKPATPTQAEQPA